MSTNKEKMQFRRRGFEKVFKEAVGQGAVGNQMDIVKNDAEIMGKEGINIAEEDIGTSLDVK